MGVGMCHYAQLVQTKNKQCKSAIIIALRRTGEEEEEEEEATRATRATSRTGATSSTVVVVVVVVVVVEITLEEVEVPI